MKTILTSRIPLVCLGTLALATTLTTTSHASLSLTALGVTVTETFAALPAANSWSTTATGFGTAGATITGDATADGRVGTAAFATGTVNLALVATQLPAAVASGTVALGATAFYHSTTGFVGTAPTGTDGTLLMATLTNNTGGTILSLSIAYDLGIQNGNVATPEAEFAGHRVYWSLTGALNSWTPIGDFGIRGTVGAAAVQTQGFSMTAPVASWAAGTNAYILWLDDNAATGADGLYFLDNVAFTPTPEPTAGLLALGACGVFGFARRRPRI